VPAGFTVTTANADLICRNPETEGGIYEI